MTEPNDQDSWSDLYRELGVPEVPAAKAPAPEPPAAEEPEEVELVAAPADDAAEGEDDFAGGLDDEDGDESPAGDASGEPGEKKRRRRRRRRKKKGAAGDAPAEAGAATATADPDAPEADEAEADGPPDADDGGEEVSPEATRDIIANWNVPSWQEIVAGLHRPDR